MRGVRATVMAALLKAREPHEVMISDLVKDKISSVAIGQEVRTRAMLVQQKIRRPVQCEIAVDLKGQFTCAAKPRRVVSCGSSSMKVTETYFFCYL
ncbi:hypothetical protein BCY90_23915 [Agrobacterium deltaense]|nr:hypothetical protein BCY90_23915 [Agrobacterium deltaense]